MQCMGAQNIGALGPSRQVIAHGISIHSPFHYYRLVSEIPSLFFSNRILLPVCCLLPLICWSLMLSWSFAVWCFLVLDDWSLMLDGFGVLFVDSCLDVACLCICCFSLFLVVSCCLISVPSALCLVFCEALSRCWLLAPWSVSLRDPPNQEYQGRTIWSLFHPWRWHHVSSTHPRHGTFLSNSWVAGNTTN